MVARPIHRHGVADRLFFGAAAGSVSDLRPGDVAYFGSAPRDAISARAIRDASHHLNLDPDASARRSIDLGDLDVVETGARASVSAAARAICKQSAVPILLGCDGESALGMQDALPSAQFILVSAQLYEPTDAALAIGVHDLTPASNRLGWLSRGGRIISATQFARLGIEAVNSALSLNKKPLVVLLDMGVIDAGHAAGATGTNVGGMTPAQFLDLIERLAEAAPLNGLALTNLAPDRDPRGHSESLAAEAAWLLGAGRRS